MMLRCQRLAFYRKVPKSASPCFEKRLPVSVEEQNYLYTMPFLSEVFFSVIATISTRIS